MLEKKHSFILLISSFSMLKLSHILYCLDFKKISFMYFVLFLTSINHWKDPAYDTKRLIDIVMVLLTTLTSSVYIYLNSKYWIEYNITILYCISLYLMSNVFYKHDYFLLSTIFHSKLHLTCLIGNYKAYKNWPIEKLN